MFLAPSPTTELNSINFPQVSLNQDYSTRNGKSSFHNNIRRPDSKNAISKMNKSEDKKMEPASKNAANDMSRSEIINNKIYNDYNANKQLLMKVDLPRPQYDSEALREIEHNSREVNKVNNSYQATAPGLVLRTMFQGKYNRRQYFFESRPSYVFRIIRQAVSCRTSG